MQKSRPSTTAVTVVSLLCAAAAGAPARSQEQPARTPMAFELAQTSQTPAPADTAAPVVQSTQPPKADAGPFSRGRTRLSVVGGWGRAFDEDYFLLGVGAGYYLRNGLDVGLDFEAWLGSDPGIYKLSPGVRYVVYQGRSLKPYFGGFYRRTFIDGTDDFDSLGGRAGVYYAGRGGSYIGAGAVYESYLDCDGSCSEVYPEFSFAVFR